MKKSTIDRKQKNMKKKRNKKKKSNQSVCIVEKVWAADSARRKMRFYNIEFRIVRSKSDDGGDNSNAMAPVTL